MPEDPVAILREPKAGAEPFSTSRDHLVMGGKGELPRPDNRASEWDAPHAQQVDLGRGDLRGQGA